MALFVNTNVSSLNAQRNLGNTQMDLSTSLQRLSTGLRINSAKDDAAGLFSATLMTSDIRGLNQSVRNAGDAISLGQTAEGALGQIQDNLQRIREIAVQSSNATTENRAGLQLEVDELTQEITRIVDTTEFNGQSLLASSGSLMFQVGQDGQSNNQINIDTAQLNVSGSGGLFAYGSSLTASGTVDVSTQGAASAALGNITTDINSVSLSRSEFGAVQNRFEAVISNLQNYSENLSAARSRIQDTDFASETATLTRAQILQQAGTSILAQANALPQAALSLLG